MSSETSCQYETQSVARMGNLRPAENFNPANEEILMSSPVQGSSFEQFLKL